MTGQYKVKTSTSTFTDTNRIETFRICLSISRGKTLYSERRRYVEQYR